MYSLTMSFYNMQIIQDLYNSYTKIYGHKNLGSSICNILVKLVQQLKPDLNISV